MAQISHCIAYGALAENRTAPLGRAQAAVCFTTHAFLP
jgi:hypothetical protein